MNNGNHSLITYVAGGIVVLVLINSIREYLIIGALCVGVFYLIKLMNDSGNNRR